MADRAATLFIVAGEHSGDRLGADLVRRLRAHLRLDIAGVGGPALIEQGLRTLYPMSDLSVMGLSDVLKRLPKLLWRVEQTANAVMAARPDAVVLIDSQEFSALVARRLRAKRAAMPVLLYVGPSVWGRAPRRAAAIRPLFDEVMAVLPFEPAVMARLGGPPTFYVGHPALSETTLRQGNPARGPVVLLPGSRPGELRRHLPLLEALVARLKDRPEVSGFVLPTLLDLVGDLTTITGSWAAPIRVTADRGERPTLYAGAVLAVVAAGTATLELALSGVPMVVLYRMDGAQARGFAKLGRPSASLPNIVLGATAVPELILETEDTAPLIAAVDALLADPGQRDAQSAAFARLWTMMDEGVAGEPRQDPATRVLSHLRRTLPRA